MATYRRRILLINKPFQLRFSVYVCGWLLGLCFIYPLIISNLFEYFIRYAASDPAGADVGTLYHTRQQVLSLLTVTEIAFLMVTFLICLFMSHRIAGPLYKLRRYFDMYAHGSLNDELRFRKKDYFPELASDFNQMVRTLRGREEQEGEILAIAASRIANVMQAASDEVKAELEPALVSIRKLQEQKASPALSTES